MNTQPAFVIDIPLCEYDKFILCGPDWYARPSNPSPFMPPPANGPYLFEANDDSGGKIYLSCVRDASGLTFDGSVKPLRLEN